MKFWLRNSSKYDSLNMQTMIIVEILKKNGVAAEIVYSDRISVFEKLKIILNRNLIVGVYGSFDPWLLLLIFSKRIRLIYHNITPAKFFFKNEKLVAIRSALGRIQLSLYRRDIKIIAVSEYNRQELISRNFSNVKYCPCVVSGNFADSYILEKTQKPSVIFTGRIVENKNVIFLINQIKKVAEYFPDGLDFFIVGSKGKNREYCKNFSKIVDECLNEGRLRIQWYSNGIDELELNKLLSTSWLYTSASLHEGFGLPICEAILAGTPALYLECGGTESILDSVGMTSIEEANDFGASILSLLENSSERLTLLQRQFLIAEQYSLKNSEKIIYQMYSWLRE